MTLNNWVDGLDEPEDAPETQRGRHPSSGFAGKLEAAENHAPPEVGFEEIRDVAQEAFDRGVKVEKVWNERTQRQLGEFDGTS